jgi:hypothetical protein
VTGYWRILCNEVLNNFLYSPKNVRLIISYEMEGTDTKQGTDEKCEMRKACKILVEKSEGKKPFRRLKNRWKDNTGC